MRAGRTERRDVPHEEGAWIEFRTLSGLELDEADDRSSEKLAEKYGKETILQMGMQSASLTITPEILEQQRKQKYDKATLIRYGIVGCSECEPCSQEARDTLDGMTREWAADVILEMNTRPLASASDSKPNSSTANSHQISASLTGSTSTEF